MANTTTTDAAGNAVVNGYATNLPVSAITPEMLQTPPAITTPTPTTSDHTVPLGIVGSVTDSIAGDYASANQAKIDAEAKLSNDRQAIIDGQRASTAGKSAFSANADETAGVNSANSDVTRYASQLADLNGQISSLNRDSQAIPIANRMLYGKNGNAGTDNTVANVNYDQLQQNALKALSLGQQADLASAALTGSNLRLLAAKDKSAKMVDLEYKPKEEELALRQKQYDLNKDALTAIDKKRTEALGVALKKEADALAEDKDNKKAISDMIVNAASANAPKELMAAAKLAKTPAEAAMILKEYAGNYYQTQLLKAQIDKQKADTAKVRAESNAAHNASVATAASSTAKDWVTQYNSGAMSLEDIYTKIGSSKEALVLKNQVASLIAAQGGKRVYGSDDASVQAITSQIKNVDDLLNGDVGSIVGLVQGGLGVLPDRLNIYKQDALATAKNLVSNQTLQSLADAKAKGITFGALSEAELNAVSNASGRIASKLIKDKDGNITGFSGSEGEFKNDLKAVRDGLQKSVAGKTMTAPNLFQQSLSGGANSTPTIMGTAIIKNVSNNGAIDFAIPK